MIVAARQIALSQHMFTLLLHSVWAVDQIMLYSMTLFLHFGSSFLGTKRLGILRGTKVAACATMLAPHFVLIRQKRACKVMSKQLCSTSTACIPIMTFCTVITNLTIFPSVMCAGSTAAIRSRGKT
jgi:hypothetical protein